MDLILSNCFYPKFVTACSKFIKLFLQRFFFFYLKWAEGLELFSLYYSNHVFANVDRFGSKKRQNGEAKCHINLWPECEAQGQ